MNDLHVELDGNEVYVTRAGGLERLCTMEAVGEHHRMADARMVVRACNSHAALIAALKDLLEYLDLTHLPQQDSSLGIKCGRARSALAEGSYK